MLCVRTDVTSGTNRTALLWPPHNLRQIFDSTNRVISHLKRVSRFRDPDGWARGSGQATIVIIAST